MYVNGLGVSLRLTYRLPPFSKMIYSQISFLDEWEAPQLLERVRYPSPPYVSVFGTKLKQ